MVAEHSCPAATQRWAEEAKSQGTFARGTALPLAAAAAVRHTPAEVHNGRFQQFRSDRVDVFFTPTV